MKFKLVTKTIFLLCTVLVITLGLEFSLFEMTDYNVYRVLDISFKDIFILFLVISLQYALIKQVPSTIATLWRSAKTYKNPKLVLSFIFICVFGAYSLFPSRLPVWIFLVAFGALCGFSLLINQVSKNYFHKAITLVLFCAGFNATFVFWIHEKTNEGKHIQYAQQLAERRDTVAENQLIKLVDALDENPIEESHQSVWEKKWLENSYLSSNYRLLVSDSIIDSTANYYQPFLIFDETSTPLYQIHFPEGYTLSFQLKKDFKRSVYTANYPYKNMKGLNDYHFVVVDRGEVVLANSHNFDLNIMDIPLPPIGKGKKVAFNGFDVLAYHHSNDVFVLIGEPLSEVLVWISNFSFFFSLFILASVLVQWARWLFFKKNIREQWQRLPIQFRTQATLIAMTVSLFFIIAATTFFFLRQNNLDITYERQLYIAETVRKAILEDKRLFNWGLDDFPVSILAELADRKQCEIDLYNSNGQLLVSSIATSENSPAVKIIDVATKEVIQENSYAIVINKYNKKEAPYLRSVFSIFQNNNLEGFAAINVLESEIGTAQDIPIIMSKLLSVYVFLLLITWGVGLALINLMTKPLRLLANRLSLFKPGKLNEKLGWEGDDVIGALIGEYNKMVDVVELTTKELMRSERQGAWQIMAQQIAHEVNNPLTPLRLNIQYFTHVIKQQTPDPETINRITNNLIEQVDHLSKVASQFKLFANMEAPQTEPLELIPFLEHFTIPYKDKEDYQFDFINNIKSGVSPTINIDTEHLQQVLKNLISNAENAIHTSQSGVILLYLKMERNKIILEVEDNGSGIDPTIQDNLFDPKFSTNSSRTGLGLPICHRIVEFYAGELNFTTEMGVGTCFRISFLSKEMVLPTSPLILNEDSDESSF